MNRRISLGLFTLTLSVLLAACAPSSPAAPTNAPADVPTEASVELPTAVPTPSLDPNFVPPADVQTAFNTALDFLQTNYADVAPADGLIWAGANVTPQDLVGSVSYVFKSGDFDVTLDHCVCAPDSIEYQIELINSVTGFAWSGVVGPTGVVSEVQRLE